MQNMIDYLSLHKDKLFKEISFNEVDAAILTRLSYINFNGVLSSKRFGALPLNTVINNLLLMKDFDTRFHLDEDKKIIEILRSSLRFKDCYVLAYVSDTNREEEKQFSATTFKFVQKEDKFIFISFRGTDGTYTGWKEDFNMVYKDEIPAQKQASSYIKNILRMSSYKKIYVGGHSKGGNLAVYASSTLRSNIKKNIIKIYAFDSPGFSESFLKTKGFLTIKNKIYHYTPISSIIGRLLNKDYISYIVDSKKSLLYQHNLYNWKVINISFIRKDKYTYVSNKIDDLLKTSLKNKSFEEKKAFVNELFEVLKDFSSDDNIDFGTSLLSFALRFNNVLKTKSELTKSIIKSIFINKDMQDETNSIKKIDPLKNKKEKRSSLFSNLFIKPDKSKVILDIENKNNDGQNNKEIKEIENKH